jgi:DNA-3-methyladenine glycosylase I
VLEINQAGLSWLTILKKKGNFRSAYSGFEIAKVARYGDKDIGRLLRDAGIIRNRLKIKAAVFNAKRIVEIQKQHGSFESWLDQHHPLSIEQWVKVFKANFKFVGGEICNEFLMSTGYLKGAHDEECPVFQQVLKQNPKWHADPG